MDFNIPAMLVSLNLSDKGDSSTVSWAWTLEETVIIKITITSLMLKIFTLPFSGTLIELFLTSI
jgi:hypothetical protein